MTQNQRKSVCRCRQILDISSYDLLISETQKIIKKSIHDCFEQEIAMLYFIHGLKVCAIVSKSFQSERNIYRIINKVRKEMQNCLNMQN